MIQNRKRRQYVQLPQEREREIIDLAEAVAEEYGPEEGKPIDPLFVINSQTITTSFNWYGNAFDGMLEHRSGRFHIYCNLSRIESPDSPRARFTLSHELGHYFIDDHRNALSSGKTPAHRSKCEYESYDLAVEQEADLFASSFLMPTVRFLKEAKGAKPGLPAILSLANTFAASVTSTAIRYVKSDLVPCAVIKWGLEGFQWKFLSTEAFRARFLKTIEEIDKLADGSATLSALKGEHPPATGFLENGTTSAAWFPFLADHDARNILLIEQAVPLGRFGVLTFLFPVEGSFRL
jgi:Zn-dependent peptidase ImmA (M78 family)